MRTIKVHISNRAYNMLMAMEQVNAPGKDRESLLENVIDAAHRELTTMGESRIAPYGIKYLDALIVTNAINGGGGDNWKKIYDPEYKLYCYNYQKLFDENYNK